MEEVFWAMGFQARRIQVRNHSAFEAYSNQAGKWIVCDASLNRSCYMYQDSQGTFLGTADIIRRLERLPHDPCALDDIELRICKEENLVPPQKHDMCEHEGDRLGLGYDMLGFCMGHGSGYQTRPTACYYLEQDREAFLQSDLPRDGNNILVEELDHMTPSRNRIKPSFTWIDEGSVLDVTWQAVCAPFLRDTMVQAGQAKPQAMADGFRWMLHDGVNELRIWTRNQLGATGYPFGLTLWKEPL